MLTFQSLLTGAAVLVAVAAFLNGRRVSRRLERLTETYWELRYEYGQLRARVARLDPEAQGPAQAPAPGPAAGTNPGSFIPLSSLKR